MQINLLNPLNLINPLAAIPAVTPAPTVGARNQTDTTQTGSNGNAAAKEHGGELKFVFPPERARDAEEALRTLGEAVQAADITLNFSRDEETGAIVVKLVDQTSGEIVRQIPQEALLHLSAVLGKLQGQIFDQKA